MADIPTLEYADVTSITSTSVIPIVMLIFTADLLLESGGSVLLESGIRIALEGQ
jgi:hypothetical protein